MEIHALNYLTHLHMQNCKLYSDYVNSMFEDSVATDLASVPYLPVRAFKEFQLKSIGDQDIHKVLSSSGTSGKYSQIFLDKETALIQTKTLVQIFVRSFGTGRFPMLVIDTESTVKDRERFSARTAAINGFSMFARDRCFALNDALDIDLDRVRNFLARHKDSNIFVFGFTFLIWSKLVKQLRAKGVELDLRNAFFLHGGGWKKLENEKVSNQLFKSAIQSITGCSNVRNYYGMVEQTGTIFMECPNGSLHAAADGDVLIRDIHTHEPVKHGEQGLIQVFSAIQKSYPGHSLLTEDIGSTQPGASCICDYTGTILKVDGRLAKAEVRGCSDAYL